MSWRVSGEEKLFKYMTKAEDEQIIEINTESGPAIPFQKSKVFDRRQTGIGLTYLAYLGHIPATVMGKLHPHLPAHNKHATLTKYMSLRRAKM